MGAGHNELKFKAAILGLSNSQDWDTAKAEWQLHFVYDDRRDRSCECDHAPIHQICVIKNRDNGNETEVGNVCVRRFLRLLSNRVFSVIKRLRADKTKSLNPESLKLFRRRGVITENEEDEYLVFWRKRTNMTDDQKALKEEVNERVLAYLEQEGARLLARANAHDLRVQQL